MGIRFYCPKGHKLNVKEFQAGRRGICPYCGEKILIPTHSSRPSSKAERQARRAGVQAVAAAVASPAVEASADPDPALPWPQPPSEIDELQAVGPLPEIPAVDPAAAFANVGPQNAPPVAESFTPSSPAHAAGAAALAPDPLADSAAAIWYVRPPTGGQFGPATAEIMRGWLAEGRISNETLVWREGWRDWLEAGGVFPQLNLPFINPLTALNASVPTLTSPHGTAASPTAVSHSAPKGVFWLIAALAVFTLLVIAGAIWFWLR